MLSFPYINAMPKGIVKSNAAQVLFITLLGLFTQSVWIVLFLNIDFLLRALNLSRFSPIAILSAKLFHSGLKLSNEPTLIKPKRFAASIGFTMTIIAILSLWLGIQYLFISLLSTLALFSFLEFAFDFCAGCKIYGILIKLNIFEEEECIECRTG